MPGRNAGVGTNPAGLSGNVNLRRCVVATQLPLDLPPVNDDLPFPSMTAGDVTVDPKRGYIVIRPGPDRPRQVCIGNCKICPYCDGT